VAFCEIEPFCRQVLQYHWPDVPIFGDIRGLTKQSLEEAGVDVGTIDVVCGGPPCQPASLAGKRRGERDDRWLWPEALRIVDEIRPSWCLFENPVGILSLVKYADELPMDSEGNALAAEGDIFVREGQGLANEILDTLEKIGYSVGAVVIPACAVGAPHRRDRVWILAHAERHGLQGDEQSPRNTAGPRRRPAGEDGEAVADAAQKLRYGAGSSRGRIGQPPDGRRRHAQPGLRMRFDGLSSRLVEHRWPAPCGCDQYPWEPPRMTAEKMPYRKQKLQALGNAVISQVVIEIGRAILHANKQY